MNTVTVEDQVEGIRVKTSSMDTRLGRVEGMTTAIHGNVTRMMAVQESQGQDISEMKGDIAELKSGVAILKDHVEALRDQAEFMRGQMTVVVDLLKRDRE